MSCLHIHVNEMLCKYCMNVFILRLFNIISFSINRFNKATPVFYFHSFRSNWKPLVLCGGAWKWKFNSLWRKSTLEILNFGNFFKSITLTTLYMVRCLVQEGPRTASFCELLAGWGQRMSFFIKLR